MSKVNPQLENGYTKIANEILDTICKTNFNSYQSRLLWAVIRKTYGFHKPSDWIALSQLGNLTGLRKQHVCRAKKELIQRNVLVTSSGYKIKFNKDYSQWKELPNGVTNHSVTQRGSTVTPLGNNRNLTGDTQKKITKETIQKKECISLFEKFWELVPSKSRKRSGKAEAMKEWKKLSEKKQLKAIRGIEIFKTTKDWTTENGRYIPGIHRWLKKGSFDGVDESDREVPDYTEDLETLNYFDFRTKHGEEIALKFKNQLL